MGKIHIIEPISNGLQAAKGYLSEINARYLVFESTDACLAEEPGDLVIILADKDIGFYAKDIEKLKKSRSHRGMKRLCVLPFELSMKRTRKQIIDGEFEHPMPLDRERFLLSVGNCLNIPQRRTFKTIVMIQPEAGGIRYSGNSVDFSETGMSFECNTNFPVNQPLTVSFGKPTGGRMQLKAVVVRNNPSHSGTSYFHGVKFIDISDEQRSELRIFVSG
jgi:hypothetical protein